MPPKPQSWPLSLPASETEKQLLPAARGRHGHTQPSAASCAPGQGSRARPQDSMHECLLSKSCSKESHCSSETNEEGGESDSPVRGVHTLQEGLSSVGSLLHAELCRCHHLSPSPAKVEEITVLNSCLNSSPLPQVWYPEGKGEGRRCEYEYPCSLTF